MCEGLKVWVRVCYVPRCQWMSMVDTAQGLVGTREKKKQKTAWVSILTANISPIQQFDVISKIFIGIFFLLRVVFFSFVYNFLFLFCLRAHGERFKLSCKLCVHIFVVIFILIDGYGWQMVCMNIFLTLLLSAIDQYILWLYEWHTQPHCGRAAIRDSEWATSWEHTLWCDRPPSRPFFFICLQLTALPPMNDDRKLCWCRP